MAAWIISKRETEAGRKARRDQTTGLTSSERSFAPGCMIYDSSATNGQALMEGALIPLMIWEATSNVWALQGCRSPSARLWALYGEGSGMGDG